MLGFGVDRFQIPDQQVFSATQSGGVADIPNSHQPARRRGSGTPLLQSGEIVCCTNDGVETYDVDVDAIPTKILVAEMAATLGLFRDVLGLKVMIERLLESDNYSKLGGDKCRGLRATVLGHGRLVFGTAVLLEFEDQDGDVFSPFNRRADRLISGAFARFRTNRIDEVFGIVEHAGYEIIYPPVSPYTVNEPLSKPREFMFRASDGILFKLVDIAAREQ